ncbi:50S ribosomal protein L15e [Candidatus Micrarchaeota archaeon]|nr:50S ribosomal protein L15e [Candidatus Micrarchaeota archaeon]
MMQMGAYKYISETLQNEYKKRDERLRKKVIRWRKEPAVVKVNRPSNISRARTLGYKAKQGYIIARARVNKGRRTRRRPTKGRKQKSYYFFKQPQMSLQATAEQKVNRLHSNMEVLNSYWVGDDGNYHYFEVILADPAKPSVNISSAIRQGKSFRGLTSAGNSRKQSKKKTPNKKRRRKAKARKPYAPPKKPEKKNGRKPDKPDKPDKPKPRRIKGSKSRKKSPKKKPKE